MGQCRTSLLDFLPLLLLACVAIFLVIRGIWRSSVFHKGEQETRFGGVCSSLVRLFSGGAHDMERRDALYSMALTVATVGGEVGQPQTAAIDDILFEVTGVAYTEDALRDSIAMQLPRAKALPFKDHAKRFLRSSGHDQSSVVQAFEMLVFIAKCGGEISPSQKSILNEARDLFSLPADSIEKAILQLAGYSHSPQDAACSSENSSPHVWSYAEQRETPVSSQKKESKTAHTKITSRPSQGCTDQCDDPVLLGQGASRRVSFTGAARPSRHIAQEKRKDLTTEKK